MQLRILTSFIAAAVFTSCNLIDSKSTEKSEGPVTYSFACLDSTVSGGKTNKAISRTTSIIRDLAVDEDKITDAVQSSYGEAFHKDAIETKTFKMLDDPVINAQLQTILTTLLGARQKPSAIKYTIHLVDDKQVNAFTFGGYIYLTKAMYDKCNGNSDLLYAIIGHEIGHSEMGHIKKTIQEMQLSDKIFGRNGITYFQLKQMLAGSFNQKNELEADYYGIDLSHTLKKNLCAAVSFWKEMAENENDYSRMEDFFRTHPFSKLRAQCLQDHLLQNFELTCQ